MTIDEEYLAFVMDAVTFKMVLDENVSATKRATRTNFHVEETRKLNFGEEALLRATDNSAEETLKVQKLQMPTPNVSLHSFFH
jgi:hypothetical protein